VDVVRVDFAHAGEIKAIAVGSFMDMVHLKRAWGGGASALVDKGEGAFVTGCLFRSGVFDVEGLVEADEVGEFFTISPLETPFVVTSYSYHNKFLRLSESSSVSIVANCRRLASVS
jgi:hypothetical protein